MFALLLSVWFGSAFAAVPVELPAGATDAAWAEAARLAGVELRRASGAPSARIAVQGTRWAVEVVARDGTRHTLLVPVPADAAAREDLLATVVSLAEPVASALPSVALPSVALPTPPKAPVSKPPSSAPKASKPAPPKAPPPTTTAAAPEAPPLTGTAAPEPTATSEPTPDPEPTPAPEPTAEPAPEPKPPRELLDLDTPTEPPTRRVPLFARLSAGAVVRLDGAPTVGVGVAGGLGVGPARLGLVVTGSPASTLAQDPTVATAPLDRALRAVDVAALLEVGDVGPWGAARAGVAVRGWSEGGADLTTTVTPTARVDAGWGFGLGIARLRPSLWAAADLAPTTFYVDGREEGALDRAFFGFDLGVELVRGGDTPEK